MALVSISEAARLTGKARSTLHKYIKQGRLSINTDAMTGVKTIDISELIRVFGNNLATERDTVTPVAIPQEATPHNEQALQAKLQLLEQENQHLRIEKELILKNLDDIRQAMLLIESKLPVTQETVKKSWKFWKN